MIIFERIKEEIKAGKGIKLAIQDGYKNAYSAIIDGQVTTGDNRVFNLQGQYVGSQLQSLPKGIYIVNGKKVTVK